MRIKSVFKLFLPAFMEKPARSILNLTRRLPGHRAYSALFKDKIGIEIGGPSAFFRDVLPLYPMVAGLDGVNFADETMWESPITAGGQFEFARGRRGRQFIAEATDLTEIDTGQYDFLLSCNCLEHVANPLSAIKEWVRIVKPGGLLLLVLPNPASNFDHKREVTRFEHLLEDYAKGTQENDMTHLQEILSAHDLTRDPGAGTREEFVSRCLNNDKVRGMHHHVFNLELIRRMLAHWDVEVLRADTMTNDFIVLGQTPATRSGAPQSAPASPGLAS